jgi:hypothetical protein
MWPSDFTEALDAFTVLTKGVELINGISVNLLGDRFLIYPCGGDGYYYVYHRGSKELYKQWPDSWRNEEHKPELIGKL